MAAMDGSFLLEHCIKGILNLGGQTTVEELYQHLSNDVDQPPFTHERMYDKLKENMYEWFIINQQFNHQNQCFEVAPESEIFVVTSLKLCKDYLSYSMCHNASCRDLHLCRDFVLSQCTNTECDYDHDFSTINNQNSFQSHRKQLASLSFLTDDQIKTLLISNRTVDTVPSVCSRPESHVSHPAEVCNRLHMCWSHINNLDPHGAHQCSYNHTFSHHDRLILQKYRLEDSEDTKRIIAKAINKSFIEEQALNAIYNTEDVSAQYGGLDTVLTMAEEFCDDVPDWAFTPATLQQLR